MQRAGRGGGSVQAPDRDAAFHGIWNGKASEMDDNAARVAKPGGFTSVSRWFTGYSPKPT
eukprot:1883628-Prymnesium_polylepis.1